MREEFFYHNFFRYYLWHMTLPPKLILILAAFGVSPLYLVGLFKRDLASRFMDTIRTKGISLFQYLFLQFMWSWLSIHLLLTVLTFIGIILELDLILSATMVSSLLVALILMSYDMHISCNMCTLILDKGLAVVFAWTLMNIVQYLLMVSEFEPLTAIRFYTYPYLWQVFRCIAFAVVPGKKTSHSQLALNLICWYVCRLSF